MNSTDAATEEVGVIYYALLGYPVTAPYLVMQLVLIILGIAAMILNGLVLSAIIPELKTMDSERYFMLSLTIMDITTGLFAVYYAIYNLVNFQNRIECLFRICCLDILIIGTGWCVMLMAFNRCIHIVKPYSYNDIFSRRNTIIMNCIPWIIGGIAGLMPAFGWRMDVDPTFVGGYECILFLVWRPSFLIFKAIFFNIPILMNAVFYIIIFKIAHSHAKSIAAEESRFNGQKKGGMEKQVLKYTKTISIVVGLYQLMFTPNLLVFYLVGFNNLDHLTATQKGSLFVYAGAFSIANSIVNPIVYAFKLPIVRAKFICCSRSNARVE